MISVLLEQVFEQVSGVFFPKFMMRDKMKREVDDLYLFLYSATNKAGDYIQAG